MRQQPEWSRGRVLGRGSTATVSLAFGSSSGELFAVKSADLARSEFLQREGRIHSAIRPSPRVVSYLGFDVTDEPSGARYNLFLEYAPGGSLSDEIKRRGSKLGEADVRAYTRDIVLGLAHLHSMRLAHCDIKGQNVLIGHDGRAKIADLGCARFVDGDARQFMGTPMFMAPEVARGGEQRMAADVWAAGCTVIEMATGRPPWPDATDAVSLLHRIAFSGDAPATPDWLSEEGKDFLRKCLARDAEQRWTAAELLQHPFLASSVPDSDSDSEPCKWTSPKSTLDQSFFWDSLSEPEEAEFKPNKPKSIPELFPRVSTAPNWTWDGDWLTVRNDDQATAAAGDDDDDDTVGGGPPAPTPAGTSSQISTTISTGISTNHAPVTDVDCESDVVISSHNCDLDPVTMLWLSNWIFLISSQLSSCFCPFALCCVVSSSLIVGLKSNEKAPIFCGDVVLKKKLDRKKMVVG